MKNHVSHTQKEPKKHQQLKEVMMDLKPVLQVPVDSVEDVDHEELVITEALVATTEVQDDLTPKIHYPTANTTDTLEAKRLASNLLIKKTELVKATGEHQKMN